MRARLPGPDTGPGATFLPPVRHRAGGCVCNEPWQTTITRITTAEQWPAIVASGLAADATRTFRHAVIAAKAIDQDSWPHEFERLIGGDRSLWRDVIQTTERRREDRRCFRRTRQLERCAGGADAPVIVKGPSQLMIRTRYCTSLSTNNGVQHDQQTEILTCKWWRSARRWLGVYWHFQNACDG